MANGNVVSHSSYHSWIILIVLLVFSRTACLAAAVNSPLLPRVAQRCWNGDRGGTVGRHTCLQFSPLPRQRQPCGWLSCSQLQGNCPPGASYIPAVLVYVASLHSHFSVDGFSTACSCSRYAPTWETRITISIVWSSFPYCKFFLGGVVRIKGTHIWLMVCLDTACMLSLFTALSLKCNSELWVVNLVGSRGCLLLKVGVIVPPAFPITS